jgi:hypothetical protein
MASTFNVEYRDESGKWQPYQGGLPDKSAALQAALAASEVQKSKARISNETTGHLVLIVGR